MDFCDMSVALRAAVCFVVVKSAESQSRGAAFAPHQCLVQQHMQLIHALRGHLSEFRLVAPKGLARRKRLESARLGRDRGPARSVREVCAIYLAQIANLTEGDRAADNGVIDRDEGLQVRLGRSFPQQLPVAV